MTERKVTLYTQPGLHFCHLENAWLSEQGIEFVDRNIAEDESALKELRELGVFSTPVTLINGAVVVGFDRDKLEQLLGLTGAAKSRYSGLAFHLDGFILLKSPTCRPRVSLRQEFIALE